MADVNREFCKSVGSRVKEIRKKNGMSQADLAVKANISLPHISSIELGKTQMLLPVFARLVEALNVSADYLLRADVPEVNGIYQGEFSELLSDCTSQEMESILAIVKQLKATMHQKTED